MDRHSPHAIGQQFLSVSVSVTSNRNLRRNYSLVTKKGNFGNKGSPLHKGTRGVRPIVSENEVCTTGQDYNKRKVKRPRFKDPSAIMKAEKDIHLCYLET